jgi:hypothetical protein
MEAMQNARAQAQRPLTYVAFLFTGRYNAIDAACTKSRQRNPLRPAPRRSPHRRHRSVVAWGVVAEAAD